MKQFMKEDFLFTTATAQRLYNAYALDLPIIDYHCHISPKEIAEDKKFENITQLWLGGDHYKWRQMRSNGVPEKYITGDGSDREKFQYWAMTLEKAIGNPLYHWSHLELKRYFDYHGYLNEDSAEKVWTLCNEKLKEDGMTAKNLIRKANVRVIGTTDDPVDSLKYHKIIADDAQFLVKVLPSFRPDRAMNIEKEDYLSYLNQLSCITGLPLETYGDLMEAMKNRLDYFGEHGCCISDHGLDSTMYAPASEKEVEEIFLKRQDERLLTKEEERKFKTAFLLFLGKEYAKRDWVMQIHYGCKRNNNRRAFLQLGADTGFDSIANQASTAELADFLNQLEETNELPKTILYSLNPNDDAAIGTVIGCFQSESAVGKIQQGSGWWFNDTKTGMIHQMTSLANLGLLGNFIGMLTDSRSFLSYTRHEYFRRILCELIGSWVENGEYPEDEKALKAIIEGISYENARKYFGLTI